MKPQHLPPELRSLVHGVTDLWGEVIREEAGNATYLRIEGLRTFLKAFRDRGSHARNTKLLKQLRNKMVRLSPAELQNVTHAFSVLLELINLCENSARSSKIRNESERHRAELDNEIYLVLTAHPTESRAPEIVGILNDVQLVLSTPDRLKPLLRRLWYLRMARREKPRVQDEAEYIYSILFRPENLRALTTSPNAKVFVRTWVGGDKDGHPGVNEKVMLKSLQTSRTHLHSGLVNYLAELESELSTFVSLSTKGLKQEAEKSLQALSIVRREVANVARLKEGDSVRLIKVRRSIFIFQKKLSRTLKRSLVSLAQINSLLETFPSLVVPLELREASDVFRQGTRGNPAILRMLSTLKKLSGNSDPRGYARGLIISMTENFEDLLAAEVFLKKALGRDYILPLIPLFERSQDLEQGPLIVKKWIRLKKLKKFEVMLGYSDSAKEGGVLPSRLAIRDAIFKLEKIQKDTPGLRLTYFHGSGGSVARGGGSLEEQTAHWPVSAFDRYKVTLQGEMIQRTFSTPEILNQYLRKVRELGASRRPNHKAKTHPTLKKLCHGVAKMYRSTVSDPAFLHMVEEASAYRFLEELRFGSRPTKRKKLEGISSLRAIPWILAWTQTRVLLPTWWGVGAAYSQLNLKEKVTLKKLAGGDDPLFASYLHQLGFTLAKIEPAIWSMYLHESKLSDGDKIRFFNEFLAELKLTTRAFADLSKKQPALWAKPWLEESIRLRSPMIHPLNVAQLIAWKRNNAGLVREASVGIACGMLTTG